MIPRSFVATTWILLLTTTASASDAIPSSLSVALSQYGCRIIEDPGLLRITKVWWISLHPLTGSESDYAFFCQAKTDPLSTRLIVHAKGERSPWKGCSETVEEWSRNPRPWLPLGLEAIDAHTRYASSMDLGKWRLVSSSPDQEVKYGPSGTQAPDLALDTSAQDVGGVFACHSGSWYRFTVH